MHGATLKWSLNDGQTPHVRVYSVARVFDYSPDEGNQRMPRNRLVSSSPTSGFATFFIAGGCSTRQVQAQSASRPAPAPGGVGESARVQEEAEEEEEEVGGVGDMMDSYELAEPVEILTKLDKTRGDSPAFWSGIKDAKWSLRRDALKELQVRPGSGLEFTMGREYI